MTVEYAICIVQLLRGEYAPTYILVGWSNNFGNLFHPHLSDVVNCGAGSNNF